MNYDFDYCFLSDALSIIKLAPPNNKFKEQFIHSLR